MASKRSREYQLFFNRLKLTARDLDSSRAVEILKTKDAIDSDVYRWMSTFTGTSNDRRERYKDYSQMIQVPELELGLTTYADDGSQLNEDNKVLEISSASDDIVTTLNETFFENLDMNADLWKIFFGTCQYGDNYYEIIVDDRKKEILSLKYIPPANIDRIEIDGNLLRFVVHKFMADQYQPKMNYAHTDVEEKERTTLQPWEVIHFKIDDNVYAPYGRSVLESGRRTYKQLALMEDAMLVYRLERAPEKRVFYIDVGTMSTAEGEKWVERIKAKFRKKKYIDPTTGKINEKATPLSMLEDFWIPVRTGVQGQQGTKIDILQGGRQLNEIDDTKYFRDKLLKTMHIPPQYMQEGGGMDSRNALSQMDIKFARTVERIQRHIIKGLEKIAIVALTLKGFRGDDLKNFQLELTPPSNIAELLEMEVTTQRINLVSSILAMEGFLPKQWVYKKIMKFSDKEIADIEMQVQLQTAQQAAAAAGPAGAGAGGIGAPAMGGAPIGMPVGPEAGGMPGLGGEMVPPAPGGEMVPVPGAEAGMGGIPPAPPPPAGGLEVAGRVIDIDDKQFLIENADGIAKIIEYVKQKSNSNKDNDSRNANIDVFVYSNSYRNQLIHGEFRGLKEEIKDQNKK